MRDWLSAVIAASLALAPATAMATSAKHHRAHIAQPAVEARPVIDPAGGNAAAGGNNANSMSGSNSAGENANGRTSGSPNGFAH